MAERDAGKRATRQPQGHLWRTVLTLGTILLVAVVIGLAAEISLQAVRAAPEPFEMTYTSLRSTFFLALIALQAALPIVAAMVAAPVLVARMLHDLQGTRSVDEAHSRLNQLLFGALGAQRRLQVKEGAIPSEDEGVARRIGGPATVAVHGDSAAVTEQGGRLKRILSPGTHTLDRYERIWETVDLRPQRWVREVFALTKEGIPISCDVDILFKIDDTSEATRGGEPGHDRRRPATALLSTEAVLRAATSRRICKRGKRCQPMTWANHVAALVESTLRDVLATYRLDWLIRAPQSEQQHPRDDIRQRMQVELDRQLEQIGARLLSIDLGQIRVKAEDSRGYEDVEISKTLSDIISGQWIDAWQANWKARALTSRAEGEAELLRMDTARIEAQVEMIIGLTEILQPVLTNAPTYEPYILALRLVEALRWMSYDPHTRDYMPPEAMRTLSRLQELLDSESDGPHDWSPGGGGGGVA